MVLDFQVDFSPFEQSCEDMIKQLEVFPQKMADELTNWQREDMKRQYPNTAITDEHTVATSIWPRSRATHPRPSKGFRGRPRGAVQRSQPVAKGAQQIAGQRSILRPELYDKMHDRMAKLLTTIKWTVFKYV